MNNNIITPTKEEVIKLLKIAKNNTTIPLQTVGDLIGIKLVDSFMPKINGTPKWGAEGLVNFFNENAIEDSFSIEDALEKLNAD